MIDEPRELIDDLVHDDHTRMPITRVTGDACGPRDDGTWVVMAGNAFEDGGVSQRYRVERCPAFDRDYRQAWTVVQ